MIDMIPKSTRLHQKKCVFSHIHPCHALHCLFSAYHFVICHVVIPSSQVRRDSVSRGLKRHSYNHSIHSKSLRDSDTIAGIEVVIAVLLIGVSSTDNPWTAGEEQDGVAVHKTWLQSIR